MSDAWKGVSRARKCPICQHEDWCGYWTPEDYGGELICCQRDKEKCNMIGSDGQEYVFIGSAKGSGSSIYEERTQYELLRKKKTGMNYSHISKPQKRELKPVDQIVPKNNENCSSIYTYMQNLLILDPAHKAYLHSQGWTDELIEKHHIVSFPEEDSLRVKYHNRYRTRNITRARLADLILQKFGSNSLEGIPGAYLKGEQWTFAGPSGLVFPMYDLDGNTFRLRIRKDFSDIDATVITSGQDRFYYAEGKKYFISMKGVYFVTPGGEKEFLPQKGKYRTLASYYQDSQAATRGLLANIYKKGCAAANQCSFYGLPFAKTSSLWYITEGEPKGLFASNALSTPVVTLPGVNSYSLILDDGVLSQMKELGMKMVVVAFDADKLHNERVLSCEKSLADGLKAAGIPVVIANWKEENGKGIDDLLASGGAPQYCMY